MRAQYTAEGTAPAGVTIKERGGNTEVAYIIVGVPSVDDDRLIPPRRGVRYSIRRTVVHLCRYSLVNYHLRVQV